MNLTRHLKEDFIDVDIGRGLDLAPAEGEDELSPKRIEELKQEILRRLVGLLAKSGKAGNESKLFNDLWNREKKASMALGQGVVLPHVRTMQAKELAIAVGVSKEEIPWGAPDGEPARIFIAMVAPPYEDRLYLQFYQRIGRLFEHEGAGEALLGAKSAGELIRYLASAGG